MRRYVLDTNIYVRAIRDRQANDDLKRFLAANTPWVYLHSVVAHELLAGALSPAMQRDTRSNLLDPFERRGRVLTPSHRAWKEAAEVMARLIREKRLSPNGITRSFPNDCLLAASARELGFTLITANPGDFGMIAEVRPFAFSLPWPTSRARLGSVPGRASWP